jgi:uncharacterized protein Smg (DUF494 family)
MLQSRIVEILLIVMGEIRRNGVESEQMEILSDDLLGKGYSKQEISTAFSWILERMNYAKQSFTAHPKSFRMLHDIERIFLSKDSYGFLLQLSSLGLLSPEEFEMIIDRVMMEAVPSLPLDDFKSIVAEILLNAEENYLGDPSVLKNMVQ